MTKKTSLLLYLPFLSANASAAVVYEYYVDGAVSPAGYVAFKDSVASPNSYWSVAAGESFIDQLEGGLSGITGYFSGPGFESAISGDLIVIEEFGSLNGTELDFGYLSGQIVFSDGSISYEFEFNITPILDRITSDFSIDGYGNPITTYGNVISAVPIPAAMWLFGSGLIGMTGIARRKKT